MGSQPLTVLARARWPESDDDRLPPLAGFTASSFNPLVAEAAERCLRARYGPPPGPGPTRTALLLASCSGDRATAAAIDAAAASQRRVPPLLFFQSNPNAVLGHIAARWELTGPVVATSPTTPPGPDGVPADALELAALLLADGDADQVLVIAAEQALPGDSDHAVALLLTPS
ncbi:hypothetical protein GXW83_13235 [Streptacidiphilus sp. PB12-B1b]|uniref:hypothetical protein n=1 Tax=Streptacidiphilus sp. PB12-B1b TaxID=2705012 RepID=UPI0015FCB9B4|nr:hypothetical protein [Streptacidiphilus sp. PB12-B1b]QMU76562.1 hypothetical protein GXW83_13235 [Streptacidiphilus sp. PB12-B1b]